MMKFLSLLLASLLTFATAFGEEFKAVGLLEMPLPKNRVDSFLNGRAKVVESKNILWECVKDLELEKRWESTEAGAIKSLSEKVSASREPETNFIRIEATGASQKEADELMYGMTSSAIAFFSRIERDQKAKYLEALNQELQDQGDLVQDFRKAVAVLTQQYGIPYFQNQKNIIGRSEMALYQKSQENLAELEQQQRSAQVQIRQLLNTPNEDLIRLAAGMDLPDNRINEHYKTYHTLMGEAEALVAGGLAPDHPKVKALKQKIDYSLSNAGKEVVSLKEVLQTKLHLIDKEVETTMQEVRSRRDGCVDLSMQQHQYNTAVQALEAALDLYSKMSRQQQELRVEFKMPLAPFYVHKLP